MNGIKCVVPIEDRQWRHWLCSPRILVQNLVYCAITLDFDRLPKFDRALNVPGIGVSIQDMLDSLARIGGEDKLALVEEKEEPELKRILCSWPALFDNKKAIDLGFVRDTTFDEIAKDYQETLQKSRAASEAKSNGIGGKIEEVKVKAVEILA